MDRGSATGCSESAPNKNCGKGPSRRSKHEAMSEGRSIPGNRLPSTYVYFAILISAAMLDETASMIAGLGTNERHY
jgi:hypothetical protein